MCTNMERHCKHLCFSKVVQVACANGKAINNHQTNMPNVIPKSIDKECNIYTRNKYTKIIENDQKGAPT